MPVKYGCGRCCCCLLKLICYNNKIQVVKNDDNECEKKMKYLITYLIPS